MISKTFKDNEAAVISKTFKDNEAWKLSETIQHYENNGT